MYRKKKPKICASVQNIFFFLVFCLTSCSTENFLNNLQKEQCAATNHNPVINSISYMPSPMTTNHETTINVDASDADGDSLTYEYISGKGTFTGTGAQVTFSSTSSVGPFYVTIIVRDSTVCGNSSRTETIPAWNYLNNMGIPTRGPSLVAHNGKIYTYGGWDGQNFQQNMYIYDPQTKTISSGGATGNLGRWYASMVVIGDKIYVYGGSDKNTVTSEKRNDILIYNTLNQSWNTNVNAANPPSSGRYYHAAIVYNNKMYVYGGIIDGATLGNPTPVDELWQYDPVANSWLLIGHSGKVGLAQRAVVVGDEMFVYRSASGIGFSSTDLQKYNFITNTWSDLSPLSAPHDVYAPSLVYIPEFPDNIFLFGGYSFDLTTSNPYLNEIWEYSISAGTWKQLSSGASARYHHAAVALNGKMFIFGGFYRKAFLDYYLNDLWVYDPFLDPLRY